MKTRKSLAAATVVLISAQTISPLLYASELSIYGTLTTQYIYRGLNISDNNPALQAGIDYEHDSNVFVGAWVSTIDLRTANGGRDLEANYYAGFHHKIAGDWAATWTLLRYAYPGAGGRHNYDHNEAQLELSWSENYTLAYAYSSDVYGLGQRATHLQVSGAWPMGKGWVLGASVGHNDLSSVGIPEYFHTDIGASVRVSRFTFDFRLYGNEPPTTPRFERASAGTRVVFSISAAL